MLVFLCISSYS